MAPLIVSVTAATLLLLSSCAAPEVPEKLPGPALAAGEEETERKSSGMTIATAKRLAWLLQPGMRTDEVKAVLTEPDDTADRFPPNAPAPAYPRQLRWIYRWPTSIGCHLDVIFEDRGGSWRMVRTEWWDG